MYVDEGRVVTGASDLAAASSCEYAWLRQLDERLGRVPPLQRSIDAMMVRTAELGELHERRVLDSHRQQGRRVEIIGRPAGNDRRSIEKAAEETLLALQSHADVVFQAAFVADDDLGLPFVGYTDFLVLQGDGSYRVQDTKLARTARVTALFQLAAYARQLRALGIPVDDEVDLVLGDGTTSTHRLKDIEPMYVLRRRRLAAIVGEQLASGRPVGWEDDRYSRCGSCEDCAAAIAEHRDMWLIHGLRGAQRAKLRSAGLKTIDDVAAWKSGAPTGGVPVQTLSTLSDQAALQIASEGRSEPLVRVIDPHALAALPAPSDGDIFFDFEGDPLWTADGATWGLDYLFGLVDTSGEFTAFWAHDMKQERQALLDFLDDVEARRRDHPDMHVYHYASYERAHLASLAQRHGVGEERVDTLLREGVLVDLYATVRRALRIGAPSYSIKAVEVLYMGADHREGVTTAADSVTQYAHYVELGDAGRTDEAQAVLDEIADYNRYDCLSTLRLRDWLRALPIAAGDGAGGSVTTDSGTRQTKKEQEQAKVEARTALETQVAKRAGDRFDVNRTADERAWGLAAAALHYHRREDKSFWWAHYARLDDPVDQWSGNRDVFLVEEAAIERDWSVKPRAKTLSRDLVLTGEWSPGSTPKENSCYLIYESGLLSAGGQRVAISATLGEITDGSVTVSERLPGGIEPHDLAPIAVVPGPPLETGGLADAIETWVRRAYALGAMPADPVGDLLSRRPPRFLSGSGPAPMDADNPAVVASLRDLDHSYLAVQGPPGTGKTYVAANTIVALVRDGWRVGVVAQSHKVVDNVLLTAHRFGLEPHLICKAQTADRPPLPIPITHVRNAETERFRPGQAALIGGTAWCFSRLPAASLDLLVIDEAGQFSLANTIATAPCATRLLLVGDPQQLPQVTIGSHPEPVDTSALGFLSAGHDVLPPEYGYFLPESRRMDGAVTRAVSELSYEGKLRSHASTTQRKLAGVRPGVKAIPLHHRGNVTSSTEEADEVVRIAHSHLGQQWYDGRETRPLEQDDIIVVSPYNAQVNTVRRALDEAGLSNVKVGTVDRFQGQEAAIAVTTLAASSAADVPRGLEFLLQRNRLNVSISRAMWIAYIVYSPGLVDHMPTTPSNLAELSRFARLVGADS
ncbi:TM0106 family RecB-like putative nuclease [Flaviflexus huanghaiensis]|uniref:TM0106 family RecB-like putative nuclease n=1 Tax=Flaviflexus huanghaiensis TaxID=1111473 RepID=UPI0015F82947|nr:TM0106 family RecB-like putative nuclease [Flaviflexus huanghaiensis]